MPKNCQFTPYWPYITYMLKIEVTTYPIRAPSQMEYAIRHMVVFNSKAYANI